MSTCHSCTAVKLLPLRKRLPIFVMGFLTVLLFPPTTNAQKMGDLFQSVVFLDGVKTIEGKKEPVSGTAFLVQKGAKIYLITAEHVARDLESQIKATVHGPEDQPLIYDIRELAGPYEKLPWFFHPEADIALVQLNPTSNFVAVVKTLDISVFIPNEQSFSQYRERVLTVVGFPLRLGTKGKFSPIFKSSKLASGLFRYPRFDNKKEATFFILDDPSTAGFSGAPLFALPEVSLGGVAFGTGPFACTGLVHGNFFDKTGGKFAAVVPSWFIVETIESYEKAK